MQPIYFFFHLAKTGGTTFVGNLYEHLKFDYDFVDLGPQGTDFREENNRPPLEQRSQEELDQIKIVVGHLVYWENLDLFPNREKRKIIFFREPVSRVISHYTFNASKEEQIFADWYSSWIKNQMTVFLYDHFRVSTLQDVLEKLETFWHIGFKEDLHPSLVQLYTELAIPTTYKNRRVAGQDAGVKELGYKDRFELKPTYQPTPEELEMIKKDHQIDTWLYNTIRNNTRNFRFVKPVNLEIPTF